MLLSVFSYRPAPQGQRCGTHLGFQSLGHYGKDLHQLFTQRHGLRPQTGRRPRNCGLRCLVGHHRPARRRRLGENHPPGKISSSQYFIVVLTPNSVESEWVRKEYTQALSLRKKIIPILLAPCDMPFALNTINFVNFAVGEYPENFKKLLPPLGFTGTAPTVAPYKKTLPPALIKFGIPGFIGLVLLLALIFIPRDDSTKTPTVPSEPTTAASPTSTATLEPPTATATDTVTVTATRTITSTPTATLTASPTLVYVIKLPVCITADSTNINVRSGPGITFGVKKYSFFRMTLTNWYALGFQHEYGTRPRIFSGCG